MSYAKSCRLATAVLLVAVASAASAEVSTMIPLYAGARAAAMGSAYLALADDASAVVWNPAALARVEGSSAVYSFGRFSDDDVDQHFLAASKRTGLGGVALGYADTDLGNLAGVGYNERQYLLGYGHPINDKVAIGLSARRLTVSSYEDAKGYDSTVGIRVETGDNSAIGLRMNGLVNQLKWDDGSLEKAQTTFDLGGAMVAGEVTGAGPIVAALEFREIGVANWRDSFRLGVEVPIHKAVLVRGGVAYNRLTGGLGVDLGRGQVDAAVAYHPALGKCFVLSGSLSF